VSVNAPETGTIKELLVNEEDTVTVGQDLIKLEPGEAPEGGKQESAPEQPKESAPAAEKPKESAPAAEKPKETPQASKPAPPKEAPKAEPKATEAKPTVGGREERRVRTL
jgi:2-oxoglutarate dehydrogenase E2 component (dihydrolipoamide succinyltransferase)